MNNDAGFRGILDPGLDVHLKTIDKPNRTIQSKRCNSCAMINIVFYRLMKQRIGYNVCTIRTV